MKWLLMRIHRWRMQRAVARWVREDTDASWARAKAIHDDFVRRYIR